ncbi:MAG: hypothetical protein IT318_18660 [Anaerolineales bacterium]|nr:hypothetical protein [Anaerolineales bacterium]
MTVRVDAKGKTYTEIVRKDEIPALIQTIASLIHGHIYLRPGLRLKDELNGANEQFIAVTDAEVYNANGQVLVRSGFLALNRAHIVWIRPDDEPEAPAEK